MRALRLILVTAGFTSAAQASPVHVPAENQVPVTMTAVSQSRAETRITLHIDQPLKQVCWDNSGPNSPYLISGSHRYRLLGGTNISDCPRRRDYSAGEVMNLRFEPVPHAAHDLSLVEGEGGERQMNGDPNTSGTRYWNFLHVKVK